MNRPAQLRDDMAYAVPSSLGVSVGDDVATKSDAADWLTELSETRYCELMDKWFDTNPEVANRFFHEAVIPAWRRAQ